MIIRALKRCKSDGFYNVFILFLKKVTGFFYRKTSTLGFELNITEFEIEKFETVDINEIDKPIDILHLSKADITNALVNESECFIAKMNDEIAGFTFLTFGRKEIAGFGEVLLSANNSAWIGPVFVDKKYRGKGINKAMIFFAIVKCKTKGVSKIVTSINAHNSSSIASFTKTGFKQVSEVKTLMILGKRFELSREIND
jgi:GNAT superfamily N-acetyltransferase